MWKRWLIATVAVFVLWQVLDFIIHGVILMSTYEATKELWRPMEEMKNGLMMIVSIISAGAFTGIYARHISPKSLKHGLWYGLIFGIGAGVSMGYGTYSFMPIPYYLAFSWFLGTLVEAVLAGIVVALIVKEPAAAAPAPAVSETPAE